MSHEKPSILAQRTAAAVHRAADPLRRVLSPAQAAGLLVLALAGAAAFGFAPDTALDDVARHEVVRTLPQPPLLDIDDGATRYWQEERVLRGDTIASLLARAGVDDAAAFAFVNGDPSARALYQLRPGRPIEIATDGEGRLTALRLLVGDDDVLTLTRDGERFGIAHAAPERDTRISAAGGVIESSLFGAADDAGLPDTVTLALAEIFGGDIDFYHDLRRGDRFAVVFETRYAEGEPVATGRILAAEFVNRGQAYRAFLWRAPDGREAYYDEHGRSSRKAFLRSPMEFSRVTSGFTLARFHPIFKSWRAHRGTDFGAPIGTPVRATADGNVVFRGMQTGYGNVMVLRHDGTYSTLYAHLSRFAAGLHVGDRVRQGETIAYVGQTGWATGPHLHYEFRVDGQPRDPMRVALPNATPLDAAQRAAFSSATAPLLQQMAMVQAAGAARTAGGD
jgi:murein DD-endopeptidase MepM/ murein hydrolase activator NlpD